MKKVFFYFLLSCTLFCTSLVSAQRNFNQLSFDFAFGYNKALRPYQSNLNSIFSGLRHAELGIRYMFTQKVGIRLNYANDRFTNDADGRYGSNFNRVGVDLVYNLGKTLGMNLSTRNTVGLLTHVGVGYTRLKPILRINRSKLVHWF